MDKIIKEFEVNYAEWSKVAMTLADMWREEGMEKGGATALSETAFKMLIERF